jgi:hypothetical protein
MRCHHRFFTETDHDETPHPAEIRRRRRRAGHLPLAALAQQTVTLKFHTFMAPQSNVWLHAQAVDGQGREGVGRPHQVRGLPRDAARRHAGAALRPGRDGVVDVVWTLPGNTAGRFPRIEVFELPFMMNNAEATSKAYWEYVQTWRPDEFKDVQVIALQVHGPGMFHTADKQIKSVADLKGMKVRGPRARSPRCWASVGATPVGMPLPQIPDALSKGTIDGCVIPWEVVPSVKVHELTKFHSEFDNTGGRCTPPPS